MHREVELGKWQGLCLQPGSPTMAAEPTALALHHSPCKGKGNSNVGLLTLAPFPGSSSAGAITGLGSSSSSKGSTCDFSLLVVVGSSGGGACDPGTPAPSYSLTTVAVPET